MGESREGPDDNPDDATGGTITMSPGSLQAAAAADIGAGPDLDAYARGTSVGRYVVLDVLGRGGMGVVYRAYDPDLNRQVALKLIAPAGGADTPQSRRRLVREAQALARLSHPNVVAVHDVGETCEGVYVAMELVEGHNARRWMRSATRSVRDIVRVFLEAGAGLAAAHAVGLVHRDFKPSNIVLGEDGRVRVLDFGLARSIAADGHAPRAGPTDVERIAELLDSDASLHSSADTQSTSLLDTPLTMAGAVMGTPAYMSPEQLDGRCADAHSDQFSYCVSMWQALFGERPYEAKIRTHLLNKMAREEIARPGGARVPAHVERALRRGLSAIPERRYPSMRELLAELSRDPARTRRRWLAAAVAMVVATVLGAGWLRHDPAPQPAACTGAEAKLAGVWGDAARSQVSDAFSRTGLAFAADAYSGAERALDRYRDAWIDMHAEACRATRVRGDQSEQLLDLRMQCLARRRQQLDAQVQVFAVADRDVVMHAVQAAQNLPVLDGCADTSALLAAVPPPENAAARARVDAVRAELADATALFEAGKFDAASARVAPLLERTDALAYSPLEAEVYWLRAATFDRTGHYQEAQTAYLRAAAAADRGRVDGVRARTLVQLAWVVGIRLGRYEEAQRWLSQARGAVDRTASPGRQLAKQFRVAGVLAYRQGHYRSALELSMRACDLAEQAFGAEHAYIAACENDIGAAHYFMGDYDQARVYFGRAHDRWRHNYGPLHPDVAAGLNNLGLVDRAQGNVAEAIAVFGRSADIGEALDLPERAEPLYNIGELHREQDHSTEALEYYARAVAVLERANGPLHPGLAAPLLGTGRVHLADGAPERAIPALERALSLRQAQEGVSAFELAECRFGLARALRAAGREVARARKLAAAARQGFGEAGDRGTAQVAAVDAWLAGGD